MAREDRVSFLRVMQRICLGWIFFAAVFGGLAATYMLCWYCIQSYAPGYLWSFEIAKWIAVISTGCAILFREGLEMRSIDARLVRTRDELPFLWDAVHDLAKRARFCNAPRIYIVPNKELQCFAFGCGLPGMRGVGVTTAMITSFARSELCGGIAHEIAHIKNKDLITKKILGGMIVFFGIAGGVLFYALIWNSILWVLGMSSNTRGMAGVLVVFGVLAVCYIVETIVGQFAKLFVSRQFEYSADAMAAWIMGSVMPLSNVFRLISVMDIEPAITHFSHNRSSGDTLAARKSDLFSSHPSYENRLKALKSLRCS